MVQLHAARSENLGIITVRGNFTDRIAGDLRSTVDQALRRFNRVILNLEMATNVDRDCLQFLCMAHCSALHAHKSLVVAGASRPLSCTGCVCAAGSACSEKYCR